MPLEALPRLTRWLCLPEAAFLPDASRHGVARWVRGWEEIKRLRDAELVIVSYGNSGRTWLRVMLTHAYEIAFDLGEGSMAAHRRLRDIDSRVPRILFTHDNYIADYSRAGASKRDFAAHRVVFLVRDPMDVIVSQYFQWKHRMRPEKKWLNRYPPHGQDISLFDFATREESGLPRIVAFMNAWAAAAPRLQNLLLVRYEDLRKEPEHEFARVLEFAGSPEALRAVGRAVELSSMERLRQRERKGDLRPSRDHEIDVRVPNALKARRGKVGGYRDDFSTAEAAQLERFVEERLDPVFGYGKRS